MRIQAVLSASLSLFLVAWLVAAAQTAEDKEKQVSLSDCPKKVQKTLKQEAKQGKIVEVEMGKVGGVAIYEAEVRFGQLEYEVKVKRDGTLLSKVLEGKGEEKEDEDADDEREEKEVKVRQADLPKKVLKTLKRESRGGEIEEIVKEQEEGKTVYEAEVEFGERDYEIEIAADGTLLRKALEEDDEDKEEHKGHDDDEEEEDDD